MELKRGDLIYYKNRPGIKSSIAIADGIQINKFDNITKIERPVKYKTIYEGE